MSDTDDWDKRTAWVEAKAENYLMEVLPDAMTLKQYKHAAVTLRSLLHEAWTQGTIQHGRSVRTGNI